MNPPDVRFEDSLSYPNYKTVFTVLRTRRYRFSMRNRENGSEDLGNSQTGIKYRKHREIQWFCDQLRAVFQTPGHRFEPVRPLFPSKTENSQPLKRPRRGGYLAAPVTRPTPNWSPTRDTRSPDQSISSSFSLWTSCWFSSFRGRTILRVLTSITSPVEG